MLGTGVGDALGAPVEGHPLVSAGYLDSLDADPPRTYTDDGAMTVGVAHSLIECGGFDGDHMAATLASTYEKEPWRGYGAGPPLVFHNLRAGMPWDRAASTMFGGSGSFGNGAAMRVAPVALFAHPDHDRVADHARHSAMITHTHPEGIDGAVAQAVAVSLVLESDATEQPEPARLASTLAEYMTTDVFRQRLARVPQVVERGTALAPSLGNGIAARDSVPTALGSFLRHPDSFRNALRTAIGLGGDADTIAAMAGALVGARVGVTGIPEKWRAVEHSDLFIQLADGLYRHGGPVRT